MPKTAAKLPAKTAPLGAAQAAQEVARGEVSRLTAAINALKRTGPGLDQTELADLEGQREAALRNLRHADLAVHEAGRRPYGPLSEKAVSKIRRLRRRVFDLHPQLLARLAEVRRLRERQQGIENAITEVKDSAEYRHDRAELLRFHGADGTREDVTRSGRTLAKLERDLGIVSAELPIAQETRIQAQAVWEGERATLQNWEEAVNSLGAAGQRALRAISQPAAEDDGLVGYSDIEVGPYQTPQALHQNQKMFGR